jgi:hypothetical protein
MAQIKTPYTKTGDVLTFKFRVPGFSQDAINALVLELLVQLEGSDDHPTAYLVEASTSPDDSHLFAEREAFVAEQDDEGDPVRCDCGEWSGEHCAWSGSETDLVSVVFMPEYLRSSHVAAGNRGSYPANGSRRIRASAGCAAEMVKHDGEWCEIIEDDLDECADCGGSTAEGTPDPHECAEIAPVSDAEANEQLVVALAALPAYNGWRAHWEYPGFLAFHRKGSPSVSATPDYNARGQIQVEVDDRPLPNVAWPREGRTPESYMAVMRPVLDSIASPLVESDEIFESVMAAMQDAEEMGGPEGAQYVALMERIAHEAQRRANTVRDTLAGTDEEVRS